MPKPVYVLGTGLSHDGSACLLKDGRICVAIEKERLTRIKHDGQNDSAAIQYCLEAEHISLSDLTLIVQNANFGMFEFGNSWFNGPRVISDYVPVVAISHHLAHAYSAFGTSPFHEAAIMIIDGCGSGFDECIDLRGSYIPEKPEGDLATLWFEKDSFYCARQTSIEPVYKDFSPLGEVLKHYPIYPLLTRHSIGGVYAGVSSYIFGGLDDSGKLMGLAPYGHPGTYDFEIFELQEGRSFVRYDWMHRFTNPSHSHEDFKTHFQEYANLAYWVQKEVERAILYIIRSRYELYQSENLCYSGGVALNAVANSRIVTETPFTNLYIQPAAGDNGLSIGCAYYGWLNVLRHERVIHNGSTSFGRSYSSVEIEQEFDKYGGVVRIDTTDDCAAQTANLLAEGNVVAWFKGGAEFGPRALGNRSILADPRLANIKDYINETVKFREEFRPFAPSVLLEDASLYFDIRDESPYMLLVGQVRPEYREMIPSVVHRDGSARIQTVSESQNPEFYRLLKEFKRLTGIGVLLNTSFNKRHMPIVETPADALAFFVSSGIHVLVIERHVIHNLKNNKTLIPTILATEIKTALQEQLDKLAARSPFSDLLLRQLHILPICLPNSEPNGHPKDTNPLAANTRSHHITNAEAQTREIHAALSAILLLRKK